MPLLKIKTTPTWREFEIAKINLEKKTAMPVVQKSQSFAVKTEPMTIQMLIDMREHNKHETIRGLIGLDISFSAPRSPIASSLSSQRKNGMTRDGAKRAVISEVKPRGDLTLIAENIEGEEDSSSTIELNWKGLPSYKLPTVDKENNRINVEVAAGIGNRPLDYMYQIVKK